MAYLKRPTSIELDIQPKLEELTPLKQTEILEDLIEIEEKKLLQIPFPIKGFQKNLDDSYTVTLTTTEQKLKLLNYLLTNNESEKYVYHPSSADIVGGRLTIIGCPNEYPNFKVRNALSQYVDVVRIKDGIYKARPTVMNGVKHATFKKTYKPLPQYPRVLQSK